jgi:IS605 OrfB family transposase
MPRSRKGKPKEPENIAVLRFKVRAECYPWLERASIETNQVWNWANETAYKALCRFSGKGQWLSEFELNNLSAGATTYFEHIGADTIQRVIGEYSTRRSQFKKVKLRWRTSFGARRSLGWIPFKAASIRRRGKYLRFCGKTIRLFEAERFAAIKDWKAGCFAQDSVGDWWFCLPAVVAKQAQNVGPCEEVGVDLGLKSSAATSDGEALEAGTYYRDLEKKIGQAQRRGHKRQAKRLHRTAARRRDAALHEFSRKIVNRYQIIVVGDVSGQKLVQTRMAKSVLDTGWGKLKMQLQYKGKHAGRSVSIVNEAYTTRTCSACKALTGPRGVNELNVRIWVCRECGSTHDRDVNAARNILSAGRCPPSVSGNEPKSRGLAQSSRVPHPRKTRKARPEMAA